jgi:dihydrofolate reductase
MSMSLDGFVTGPNDSRENPFGDGADTLHNWFLENPTEADLAFLTDGVEGTGAVVMGRKSFDKCVEMWGANGPLAGAPVFVVTHHAPTEEHPPCYRFVTDGVASALEQAEKEAGDRAVGLHGATVMQQALPLGLVDEIIVHVVPVLIGGGTRLFETFDSAVTLERTDAIVTPGATHLRFRVIH